MLGARTFPGNPYDGHILSAALEQATNLTRDFGLKLKQIVVDLGFRGVDADNPDKEIIHRGKYKRLSERQKGWLKRRQAIEPAIGHLKSDHRMDRCWLQGALGDALHSISCAAGYNLRWLLRAIARLGIGAVFCICCRLPCHGHGRREHCSGLMLALRLEFERFEQRNRHGRKTGLRPNRKGRILKHEFCRGDLKQQMSVN